MAAIRSFSTAAVRPLGSGATWRTIVKRQRRSELKLYNEFATLPPKWVKKGDSRSFHRSVGRLSLFQKNIFPFSRVEPLGYKSTNEGTVTFWGKIWGSFPFTPFTPNAKTQRKTQKSTNVKSLTKIV